MTSLGVLIAAKMESMQSFQMVMNFLIMPLYFLSRVMFPMASESAIPLLDVAPTSGLIRWTLAFDVLIMFTAAGVLAAAGAYSFSRSNN